MATKKLVKIGRVPNSHTNYGGQLWNSVIFSCLEQLWKPSCLSVRVLLRDLRGFQPELPHVVPDVAAGGRAGGRAECGWGWTGVDGGTRQPTGG